MVAQKKSQELSFLKQLSTSGLYNSEELVIQNSDQLINNVRGYLKTAGYDMALACMDLAIAKKKDDIRGDGDTPGIIHEISQALYTISLIEDGVYLADPESVIALNFLHDLGEDHKLKPQELKTYLIEKGIPENDKLEVLIQDFDILQKKYGKREKEKFPSEWEYYQGVQESENASIAKMPDRIHNITTQIGVKSNKRALQYIANTKVIYDDFTRHVSNKFPQQKEAYNIYKEMIRTASQINRYHYVEKEIGKPLPDMDALAKEHPSRGFKLPDGLNPICINAKRLIKHSHLPENMVQKSPTNTLQPNS